MSQVNACSCSSASTSKKPPKPKAKECKNLVGVVTYVDENGAFIDVTDPKQGVVKAKLTQIGVLQRSTGFRDVVQDVEDFLSVSDQVIVDIKQNTNKKWRVSSIRFIPYQRPNQYKMAKDYVRRKHPGHWTPPSNCHVPSRRSGEVVSIMSEVLHQWSRVPASLFLRIVEELFDDLDGVFDSYITTEKSLLSFVRTVPQYFFVDDQDRVCVYEGIDPPNFKSDISNRCLEIPVKSRQYTLGSVDDVRIIRKVREAFAVLQPMLERARERQNNGHEPGLVVALDCEGVNLGKDGRLTLVQISTMDGQVYLFDVLQCPPLFEDGLLKEFLESDAVLKVIHDCRQDTAALYHQFNVTLTNVFDTSIAYLVLQDQCQVEGDRPRARISFKNICELIGQEVKHKNKKFHNKMIYTPNFWARRPLMEDMIIYAASDVYLLVPDVYEMFDRLIHPNWKIIFKLLCENTIAEQIGDEEFVSSESESEESEENEQNKWWMENMFVHQDDYQGAYDYVGRICL